MTNTHHLRQTAAALMAVVSLCLLNGCLHLEQKLQFLRDGSVIALHYAVPAAMLPSDRAQDALNSSCQPQPVDDAASAQLMNWF